MQSYVDGLLGHYRTGLGMYRDGTLLGLCRKTTVIRATSAYIADNMSLQRQCEDPRSQLSGKPVRGSHDDAPNMARLLVEAIVHIAPKEGRVGSPSC